MGKREATGFNKGISAYDAAIDKAFQRDEPVTGLVATDHTDNTGVSNPPNGAIIKEKE